MASGLLQRLTAANTGAQAMLAGAYVWGVTVAPAAWSRGAPGIARGLAVAALVALAACLTERRFGERARRVGLWGFVVGCAVVWSVVPGSLAPLRIDGIHGLAGMLGWALLALTVAAPARPPTEGTRRLLRTLPPRQLLAKGDLLRLWLGGFLAFCMQVIGWLVPSVERALLVRLAVLASGLAIISTSAEIALARHELRGELAPGARLRAATTPLFVLGALVLVGALFALRGW